MNQRVMVNTPLGLRYPEFQRSYPSHPVFNSQQHPGYPTQELPYHIVWKPNINDYPRNHSAFLGILQLVCGLGCIIIGLCSIIYNGSALYFIGYGIWAGGIPPIVSGAFGVACAFKKNRCLIAGQIASSVTSICFSTVSFAMSITAISLDHGDFDGIRQSQTDQRGRLAVSVLSLILSLLEAILAVWVSGLACHFCCCLCCVGCCCTCYSSDRQNEYTNNAVESSLGIEQIQQQNKSAGVITTPAYTALKVDEYETIRQSSSIYTSIPGEEGYEQMEC